MCPTSFLLGQSDCSVWNACASAGSFETGLHRRPQRRLQGRGIHDLVLEPLRELSKGWSTFWLDLSPAAAAAFSCAVAVTCRFAATARTASFCINDTSHCAAKLVDTGPVFLSVTPCCASALVNAADWANPWMSACDGVVRDVVAVDAGRDPRLG